MGFVIHTIATEINKFARKKIANVPLMTICADMSGSKPINIPIAQALATE